MTASVARFIESFIPENYNLFLDINRSEKDLLQGMLPLQVKPLITISPFTKRPYH